MPFDLSYEHNGAGLVVTVSGSVTSKEVHDTFHLVWDRPDAARLRYHIIHILDGASFHAPIAELRELGRLVPQAMTQNPGVCFGFATSGKLMMGTLSLAVAFARAFTKNPRIHLGWTMTEIRAWVRAQCPDLDLPHEH